MPRVGLEHQVREAFVVRQAPGGRRRGPGVGAAVGPDRVHGFRQLRGRGRVAPALPGVHRRSLVDERQAVEVEVIGEHEGLAVPVAHLAVVRNQHQVDLALPGQGVHAVEQPLQSPVHGGQRRPELRRAEAVPVGAVVHLLEVQGDEVGTGVGWRVQPGQHLVDAGFRRDVLVVGVPVRGAQALHGRLAAHPEKAGRDHALALGGHPDRLPTVEAAVLHRVPVPEGVPAVPPRIRKLVAHDAVVRRGEARDQAVMVGEGERRPHRNQPFGPLPGSDETPDPGGGKALRKVPAVAVHGHQDHHRRVPMPLGVHAAGARLLRARVRPGDVPQGEEGGGDQGRRPAATPVGPSRHGARAPVMAVTTSSRAGTQRRTTSRSLSSSM